MKKSELDQQDKYIKALMDISRAITSDQYLEDILKLILMVTAKVTGVEICSLWLIVGYRSAAWTRGNPCASPKMSVSNFKNIDFFKEQPINGARSYENDFRR